ncbi:transposase [Pontibacter sp. H249]|uniref:transposase n=1 Tax=Pontibacter sp. H249 TaxID=3133420 RepID=UPI0030BC596B
MEVLSEDSINKWVVPQLSVGKRGPKLHVAASKVVGAILYKLKTGCQWRLLPVKELLGEEGFGWQGVCITIFKNGLQTAASGGYG